MAKPFDIPLGGITAALSPRACKDGDLDAASNLINEGDGLRPLCRPAHIMEDADGKCRLTGTQTIVFLHRNMDYGNFVVRDGAAASPVFLWRTEDDDALHPVPLPEGAEPACWNAVGNTLLAICEDRTWYLLYDRDTAAYRLLGDRIPELLVSFGLTGHPRLYSRTMESGDIEDVIDWRLPDGVKDWQRSSRPDTTRYTIRHYGFKALINDTDNSFSYGHDGSGTDYWSEDDDAWLPEEALWSHEFREGLQTELTQDVMGFWSKFNAKAGRGKDRFTMPFFACAALRLYDGTTASQTPPVLMNPCTSAPPVWGYGVHGNKADWFIGDAMLVACDLDYALMGGMKKTLADWKDIILSVDFFVSSDMYPFRAEGRIKRFVRPSEIFKSSFIGRLHEATLCPSGRGDERTAEDGRKAGEWHGRLKGACDREGEACDLSASSPCGDGQDAYAQAYRDAFAKAYAEGGDTSKRFAVPDEHEWPWFRDCVADCLADRSFLADYSEYAFSDIYRLYFSNSRSLPVAVFGVEMPVKENADYEKELKENSAFYLIKSIDVEELPDGAGRHALELDEGTLGAREARESLKPLYRAHEKRGASFAAVYNGRLHLCGVQRNVEAGLPAASLLAWADRLRRFAITEAEGTHAYVGPYDGDGDGQPDSDRYVPGKEGHYVMAPDPLKNYGPCPLYAEYRLKIDGKEYVFAAPGPEGFDMLPPFGHKDAPWTGEAVHRGSWLFAPYEECSRLTLKYNSAGQRVYDMKKSNAMDGAVSLLPYGTDRPGSPFTPLEGLGASVSIPEPGTLYVSEAGNPFVFRAEDMTNVGASRLLAVASASKALSEGQFGDFPLYAFTDEGVWALSAGQNGQYGAAHPLTMDVVTDTGSIVPVDNQVVFPTSRGIMALSGSSSRCISDAIWSPAMPCLCDDLPRIAEAFPRGAHCGVFRRRITVEEMCRRGFKMVYDYPHQRLYVFDGDPAVARAWVFSMRGGSWGEMHGWQAVSAVGAYPRAVVQCLRLTADGDGEPCVIDLSAPSHSPMPGCLVTRPLKFGAPDAYKTVYDALARGWGADAAVKGMALYGSRDGRQWALVRSCRGWQMRGFGGSPYKYFRLAAEMELPEDGRIDALTLTAAPRLGDKPR